MEQSLEAFRLLSSDGRKFSPMGFCLCLLELYASRKEYPWLLIRAGMRLDLLAATTLVDLYSKSNKLIQSRELFDRMEKKDAILTV
ncbi:hypothetical protein ACFX16_045432 [Malus domestica]